MASGRKLAVGGTVVVGITIYLAYVGAAASWQYYLTVDECLSNFDRHVGARVRVSGRVVADSLKISADRTRAEFSLECPDHSLGVLPVVHSGQIPDNIAERLDVIVEGRLEPTGLLRSETVLTRCASKYEPAEQFENDDFDPHARVDAT